MEKVNGHRISVRDYGDKVVDRYTVVYWDDVNGGQITYLAMSQNPFSPLGFCQHGYIERMCASWYLGKLIRFADLPIDCQNAVINDLTL